MDYKVMAKNILEKIGGAENVRNMTHCATRLRLTLHDTAKADDQAVENIDGVINVINKAGQYQLLIGTEVGKLYDEFEPLVKGNESSGSPIW